MTDIFDAGSDDEAIAGEHVGYVPCDDQPFPVDAADDSEAVDGSDAGYVADGTEAGDFADSDDGQAVYGSAVGFVAKPCCGIRDTFTRTVAGGWDETDSGETWTLQNGLTSYFSVNGAYGVVSLPASTLFAPQATEKIPLTGIPSGYTHDFRFDYIHPTGRTDIWTRIIGDTNPTANLGVAVQISGSSTPLVSSISLNNVGDAATAIDPSFWVTGTWYSVRYAYDGTDHMARVWKTSDPEPTSWMVTATVTGALPADNLRFLAEVQMFGDNVWPATVTEWDNLCIVLP